MLSAPRAAVLGGRHVRPIAQAPTTTDPGVCDDHHTFAGHARCRCFTVMIHVERTRTYVGRTTIAPLALVLVALAWCFAGSVGASDGADGSGIVVISPCLPFFVVGWWRCLTSTEVPRLRTARLTARSSCDDDGSEERSESGWWRVGSFRLW